MNYPVTRTERGWGGHFCGCAACRFRRNTLLRCSATRMRIVVSTVGNYQPQDDGEMVALGVGCGVGYGVGAGRWFRYYETMAFKAQKNGPCWDADPAFKEGQKIHFDAPWWTSARAPKDLSRDVDNHANDMHEAVVKEITQKLAAGEKFLKRPSAE